MKIEKIRGFTKAIDAILTGLRGTLRFSVVSLFKNVNRTVRLRVPSRKVNEETYEHVDFAFRVLRLIVLPASMIYVLSEIYLLGQNTLDSALWGLLVFMYSSFLPDLPRIFGDRKKEGKEERLPWTKTYALLLFAPLFLLLLYSGQPIGWKTTRSFHDFRSAAVYGSFLLLSGLMLFWNHPISLGHLPEILSLSFYGVGGFLTHLKVDKIW